MYLFFFFTLNIHRTDYSRIVKYLYLTIKMPYSKYKRLTTLSDKPISLIFNAYNKKPINNCFLLKEQKTLLTVCKTNNNGPPGENSPENPIAHKKNNLNPLLLLFVGCTVGATLGGVFSQARQNNQLNYGYNVAPSGGKTNIEAKNTVVDSQKSRRGSPLVGLPFAMVSSNYLKFIPKQFSNHQTPNGLAEEVSLLEPYKQDLINLSGTGVDLNDPSVDQQRCDLIPVAHKNQSNIILSTHGYNRVSKLMLSSDDLPAVSVPEATCPNENYWELVPATSLKYPTSVPLWGVKWKPEFVHLYRDTLRNIREKSTLFYSPSKGKRVELDNLKREEARAVTQNVMPILTTSKPVVFTQTYFSEEMEKKHKEFLDSLCLINEDLPSKTFCALVFQRPGGFLLYSVETGKSMFVRLPNNANFNSEALIKVFIEQQANKKMESTVFYVGVYDTLHRSFQLLILDPSLSDSLSEAAKQAESFEGEFLSGHRFKLLEILTLYNTSLPAMMGHTLQLVPNMFKLCKENQITHDSPYSVVPWTNAGTLKGTKHIWFISGFHKTTREKNCQWAVPQKKLINNIKFERDLYIETIKKKAIEKKIKYITYWFSRADEHLGSNVHLPAAGAVDEGFFTLGKNYSKKLTKNDLRGLRGKNNLIVLEGVDSPPASPQNTNVEALNTQDQGVTASTSSKKKKKNKKIKVAGVEALNTQHQEENFTLPVLPLLNVNETSTPPLPVLGVAVPTLSNNFGLHQAVPSGHDVPNVGFNWGAIAGIFPDPPTVPNTQQTVAGFNQLQQTAHDAAQQVPPPQVSPFFDIGEAGPSGMTGVESIPLDKLLEASVEAIPLQTLLEAAAAVNTPNNGLNRTGTSIQEVEAQNSFIAAHLSSSHQAEQNIYHIAQQAAIMAVQQEHERQLRERQAQQALPLYDPAQQAVAIPSHSQPNQEKQLSYAQFGSETLILPSSSQPNVKLALGGQQLSYKLALAQESTGPLRINTARSQSQSQPLLLPPIDYKTQGEQTTSKQNSTAGDTPSVQKEKRLSGNPK